MVARHLKRGTAGEKAAEAFLRGKGYQVLDSNWRFRGGELDLVCSKKDLIIFVEVKTRKNSERGLPGDALTPGKQKKLVKTASAYLSKYKLWASPCRFDLISVYMGQNNCKIDHEKHVFEFSQAVGSGYSHWQPW